MAINQHTLKKLTGMQKSKWYASAYYMATVHGYTPVQAHAIACKIVYGARAGHYFTCRSNASPYAQCPVGGIWVACTIACALHKVNAYSIHGQVGAAVYYYMARLNPATIARWQGIAAQYAPL